VASPFSTTKGADHPIPSPRSGEGPQSGDEVLHFPPHTEHDSRETVSRETVVNVSFTNTELAEDLPQQIFNTDLPRD
jgi:hypothetical protein